MPNLRIVTDNAIARAASLLASSTVGTLGVESLARDSKSSFHRAAGTAVTYTATWADPEPLGCVALPFCNLSPAAQWRIRASAELGATNLLKYSEDFTRASPVWWRQGASAGVTANLAASPAGTMTADKLLPNPAAASPFYIEQQVTGLADNALYSGSLFGLIGEMGRLVLSLVDKAGSETALEVNLDDGRTICRQIGAGQNVFVDVTAAPGGWHRLKIKGWSAMTGSTVPRFRIYPAHHNQVTGATVWTRQNLNSANVSATVTGPFPTWGVDELTEGTSSFVRYAQCALRGEAGRTLVVEQTIKLGASTARFIGMAISGAGGADQGAVINASTGAISFKTAGAEVTNQKVEALGSGWYRLSAEVTPSVTGTILWQIRMNAVGNTLASTTYTAGTSSVYVTRAYAYAKVLDNTYAPFLYSNSLNSYTHDSAKGMFAWAAMLEPGAEVTSYYPSMAATPGVRPAGYMDGWQETGYDSGWVLACPAPAVKLRGFTAAQAASAYAYGGGACARYWFPAVVQARTLTIEISDPANLQGYIEAACMVVGPVWSPKYNASATSVSVIDRTEIMRGAAGDQLADPGTISRKVPVDLRAMPEADRERFLGLVRNSRAYPLLLSVFPEHPDTALERDFMIYGRRTKDSDIAYQFAGAYATTLEIEEI